MVLPFSDARSRNMLLCGMTDPDFNLIANGLEEVEMGARHIAEEPGKPMTHVYFPTQGILSVVAISHDHQVEIGLVGREGMSGIAVVCGNDRSTLSTYAQIPGRALRLKTSALRRAMDDSPDLQAQLLRFAQAFFIQTAHTALANGRGSVEQRLARWLLMAHDRVDDDTVPLTQELLALMLGVRRPSVTIAHQVLESKGMVQSSRGVITICDRAELLKTADGFYGVPEAEYERLTGAKLRRAV